MAKAQPLKVSPDLQIVSERFRSERMIERFSQAELAKEIGVTRSTIANFEYGAARVTFAAGFAFCRRLDLNPRWLATGEEPKRPFVEPAELGIEESALRVQMLRGVDFLQGYSAVLAKPLAAWLKKMPMDQIILRQIEAGPAAVARRLSSEQLEAQMLETVVALRHDRDDMKLSRVQVAEALLQELRVRLEAKYPRQRNILNRR